MFSVKCKICDKEFTSDINGPEKANLSKHIKKVHNLQPIEYVLSGAEHPKCACGCGNNVRFVKFVFLKYYKDHKNSMTPSNEMVQKIKLATAKAYRAKLETEVDVNEITKYWERYKTDRDCNMAVLQKESGYDSRTLQRYWLIFDIASAIELRKQKRLHKYSYSKKPKSCGYQEIDIKILKGIYELLLTEPNKYSFTDLKLKFSVPNSILVLEKRLIEQYSKGIIIPLVKLKHTRKSIEEVDFGNVLIFYFGEKNVKTQFSIKFISDTNKKSRRYYDFCLFDKLLVEYDGEYWHSSEETKKNDKFKDELAISHGFGIFRVASQESKNIDVLLKLKKEVDEIQTNKNRKN